MIKFAVVQSCKLDSLLRLSMVTTSKVDREELELALSRHDMRNGKQKEDCTVRYHIRDRIRLPRKACTKPGRHCMKRRLRLQEGHNVVRLDLVAYQLWRQTWLCRLCRTIAARAAALLAGCLQENEIFFPSSSLWIPQLSRRPARDKEEYGWPSPF